MAENWYVANTQAGREAVAQAHLVRQGFKVWIPTYRKTVRHARRQEEKSAPLFPGYLFVQIDDERQRWRSVNGTIGVRSLVMEGERPLPCPKGLVDAIKVQARAHELDSTAENSIVDDKAQSPGGSPADLREKLIALDGAERARVLLQLMRGEAVSDFSA